MIGKNEELNDYLRGKLQRFIFLDETIRLPISVQYETPELWEKTGWLRQLGLITGTGKRPAGHRRWHSNPYELIEASGIYLGGNISPGMTTRFKALNFYTKKLPLVTEQEEILYWEQILRVLFKQE